MRLDDGGGGGGAAATDPVGVAVGDGDASEPDASPPPPGIRVVSDSSGWSRDWMDLGGGVGGPLDPPLGCPAAPV